jgi:hypothetical protein
MHFFRILFLFLTLASFSQEKEKLPLTEKDTVFYTKIDSLFREDQFYFGLTYNLLSQKPNDFAQNGLSTGIDIGFLRDMPINKKRTFAVALGLGFSYNKYRQNLLVSKTAGTISYEILQDANYSRNKLEQVFLDFPLELRWRSATPESHKFWRVYTGFKVRYLLFDKTKYIGETEITVTNNNDFNKLQYGPFVAFGFNTWNFHAYYGLNPIFKTAAIDGKAIDMKTLNLGLMFYIL